MPKICYEPHKFRDTTRGIIDQANEIAELYAAQNFDLTLRQLFYQFVSRNWLINDQTQYKRLGNIIRDARMAGRVDWEHITDRTRWVRENQHWDGPKDVIDSAIEMYAEDKWTDQSVRPIVLIEKDALAGVIDGTCRRLDIPFFPCRGYSSIGELWALVQRKILGFMDVGQIPVILYLGDHDPSGIDMDRDIQKRLRTFVNHHTGKEDMPMFFRLGLNVTQINQFRPPPNTAKEKDKRLPAYEKQFGTKQCWELDALDPPTIAGLIQTAVLKVRDQALWDTAVARQEKTRDRLARIRDRWDEIEDYLDS